jgi:hypothetical protein
MRDSADSERALERVAIYMAEILLSSVVGFTSGVISGAVVAGPQGSLIGGILGALLATWFTGRLISPFSS